VNWTVIGTLILLLVIVIFYMGFRELFRKKKDRKLDAEAHANKRLRAADVISRFALGISAVIYLIYIFFPRL
jgi:uncharacterized membrane protein